MKKAGWGEHVVVSIAVMCLVVAVVMSLMQYTAPEQASVITPRGGAGAEVRARAATRRDKRLANRNLIERQAMHAAAGAPAFGHAVFPVSHAPNWGAMRTPEEWSRTYDEMTDRDFVGIPPYDLARLGTKIGTLLARRTSDETQLLTEKLFYSTRYFGAYDLDAGEFTGTHAGIDLKLPVGMPIGAVAGGRVQTVAQDDRLGIHVIIAHEHPADGLFYSVYGHLGSAAVLEGADVGPGQIIGYVGKTGKITSPHLHLQIDRGTGNEGPHVPYQPAAMPTREEAALYSMNPIVFIRQYGTVIVDAQ